MVSPTKYSKAWILEQKVSLSEFRTNSGVTKAKPHAEQKWIIRVKTRGQKRSELYRQL